MNTHQRRLGRKQRKQIEARLKEAKKRDVDGDCPFYLPAGRTPASTRVDRMPPVVRVGRER